MNISSIAGVPVAALGGDRIKDFTTIRRGGAAPQPRVTAASRQRRQIEASDLKNGATEPTKRTKRRPIFLFVSSVGFVAPFLRSGTSICLRCLEPPPVASQR
jgi:hypothetical protein